MNSQIPTDYFTIGNFFHSYQEENTMNKSQ